MFEVWTAVKVINQDHARANTAGVVTMRNVDKHPDAVIVRFDADRTEEEVKVADLQAL